MAARKTSKAMNDNDSAGFNEKIAKMSFEEAMGDLEGMIERIESGEVGLEESLKEYERGIALFRHCRAILDQAEQKFEKLRLDDEEHRSAGDASSQKTK